MCIRDSDDTMPRNMHAPGTMNPYYERAGRELPIKDCTPGGTLTQAGVLEYVPLEDVLG